MDPLLADDYWLAHAERFFLEQLHELIHHQVEPPFSLSLNGSWGSGKTSLMKALESKLTQDGFPILWFNPWEYERAEDVVQCFLANLSRKAESQWDVATENLGIFALTAVTGIVDAAFQLLTNKTVSFKNTKEIYDQVNAAISDDETKFKDPIAVIHAAFAKLTQEISNQKKHGKRPLVVFLDDLDRCLPDKALEMLEALKNLFVCQGARVIFIAGIDTEVAKSFIMQRYENIPSSYAANYFRKIFHATVNVPLLDLDEYKIMVTQRFDELRKSTPLPENIDTTDMVTQVTDGLEQYHVRSIRFCHNVLQNYFLWFRFYGAKASKANHIAALEFLLLKEKEPDTVQKMADLMRTANPSTSITVFLQSVRNSEDGKILLKYPNWRVDPPKNLSNAFRETKTSDMRWL